MFARTGPVIRHFHIRTSSAPPARLPPVPRPLGIRREVAGRRGGVDLRALTGEHPQTHTGIVTLTGCRGTKLHIEYQDVVLLTISRGGLSL